MKLIIFTLVTFTSVVFLYVSTPNRPSSVHTPLPPGERNGTLTRLGDSADLKNGTKIYFRTDYSSAGVVLDTKPLHTFPDGAAEPGILFRLNNEKAKWIKRAAAKHFWVERQ